VAYNAVIENTRLKPGDRVIVLGPGTIGILCAAVARLAGAEVAIVGLENDRHRLTIAEKSYGCTSLVGDATAWARQRDGLGADVIIDAAGHSSTLKLAMELVRPAGWITKVGWGPQPLKCHLTGEFQSQLAGLGARSRLVGRRQSRRPPHRGRAMGSRRLGRRLYPDAFRPSGEVDPEAEPGAELIDRVSDSASMP
jgi:threonine dehydrogenase-like Zn-dependent dehydrogenase